jgi:hypothetical protein
MPDPLPHDSSGSDTLTKWLTGAFYCTLTAADTQVWTPDVAAGLLTFVLIKHQRRLPDLSENRL